MKATRCILAFLILLYLVLHLEAVASDIPYTQAQLDNSTSRLQGKIRQLWQLLYDNLLDPTERQALRNVQIMTPVVGTINGTNPRVLEFYSRTSSQEVFIPVVSALLIEDLCTAYAWLQVNGYEHSTIDEYLAMLRYRNPADFPGNRFPPPLRALGIPENALHDPSVDTLSIRLRNGAWAFILLHEIGHLLYRDTVPKNKSATVAQQLEMQADKFALQIMSRDNAVPMGAFLYWQASVHYLPNRADFPSDVLWRHYLEQESTHPMNAERALFIAHYLRDHAADFANKPDAVPNQKKLVQEIASGMQTIAQWLGNEDRQKGARELAKITTPATLKLRRPQKN
jgi:hypothetical protein